jgi:hypothetical protein
MTEAEAGECDKVVEPIEDNSCVTSNGVCFLIDGRNDVSRPA